jgi:hypothetical protein
MVLIPNNKYIVVPYYTAGAMEDVSAAVDV